MKKIILTISLISVLFLVGCDKKQEVNNNVIENTNNQNQESIINSGENEFEETDGREEGKEIVEEEHENPYLQYTQSFLYNFNNYEEYIEGFANVDEEESDEFFRISIEELQILKNLPFAKRGHDFKDVDLTEFFSKQDWYKKIEGKQVDLSELNSSEQKFLSLVDYQIKKYSEKMNNIPRYEFDANKEIVYSFYRFEKNGKIFDFPYINIDSENIKKLNDEIYDWAMPIILGTYFECELAEYRYYLNDDILTVIIEEKFGYGGRSGFHYNIDVKTGEFVSNLNILSKKDIEIKNIPNLKEKLLESKIFNSGSMELSEDTTLKDYCSQLFPYMEYMGNEILENPEKWTLVYLDNEQKIHVILQLPTTGGATDGVEFLDCIVEF